MIYKGPGNPRSCTMNEAFNSPPPPPPSKFSLSSCVSLVENANGRGGGGWLVCEKSKIIRRRESLVIQYFVVYIELLRENRILYLCYESYIVCKENIWYELLEKPWSQSPPDHSAARDRGPTSYGNVYIS
jgi:hypothetical protein